MNAQSSVSAPQNQEPEKPLDVQKWEAERAFREREISLKEREQANKDSELTLKRHEQARFGWRSPLVVAIIAATLAALSNAGIALLNGKSQRQLEDQKAEDARILEMIKTGNPDKGAENLQFLLDAGLVSNEARAGKLEEFLKNREPGTGPSLPAIPGGIVGVDDARKIELIPESSGLQKIAPAVGRLQVTGSSGKYFSTAFLIGSDLALTFWPDLGEVQAAQLQMDGATGRRTFEVQLPPIALSSQASDFPWALLRINSQPGSEFGFLRLSAKVPATDDKLDAVYYRAGGEKLAIFEPVDAKVLLVEEHTFVHSCDTGPGTAGSPLLLRGTDVVAGLHCSRHREGGGVAARMDKVYEAVKQHLPSPASPEQ